jgi:acetyltransferase-like isoleucine patch superfamily enzyme
VNSSLTKTTKANNGIIPTLGRIWTIGRRLLLHRLYSWVALLRLEMRGAQIGQGFRAYGWIDLEIHPLATVVFGGQVRVNSGFALNPVGGYRRTGIWVGKNAALRVGNNVGMSNCTIACMNSVTIEDDVFIGGDCKIYDTDFHPLDPAERAGRQIDKTGTARITIGAASFIGAHSLILKGVEIGSKAVVGAGSVVTTDVPAGEIWAGVPARCIGTSRDAFTEQGA